MSSNMFFKLVVSQNTINTKLFGKSRQKSPREQFLTIVLKEKIAKKTFLNLYIDHC